MNGKDTRPSAMFVDDEQNILSGLRRMLHPLSGSWELIFIDSGIEAMRILASRPIDVIVSDMRMPGIDGATLLRYAQAHSPATVRLVLSAHADHDEMLQSSGPIHQFLAKPCDAETLRRVLLRVLGLRAMMTVPAIRASTAGLETLPALPESQRRLIAEFGRPEASVQSVGDIVASDVAMTAKLLQLVNSAFFGGSRQLRTAQEAVGRLGLNTVRTLVVSMRVFAQLTRPLAEGFSLACLLRRGFTMGQRCRELARKRGVSVETMESAALAGTLHEIGRLALAMPNDGLGTASIALAASERITLAEAETRTIGVSQGKVGAYLLGLWGFSDAVVDAIASFERPDDASGSLAVLAILHEAASDARSELPWRVNADQEFLKRSQLIRAAAA